MATLSFLFPALCAVSLLLRGSSGFRIQQCRDQLLGDSDWLECPVWFEPRGNYCVCSNSARFSRQVLCFSGDSYRNASLSVASFYCVTYDEAFNTTVIGTTIYTPGLQTGSPLGYYPVPVTCNVSEFNEYVCGQLNMEGRLCGRCKDGYSLQFATHTPKCIRCNYPIYYWSLFLLRGILPTTLLYVLLLFFKVDINTPPAVSIIMFSQLYYYVFASRLDGQLSSHALSETAKTVNSFYGILNLQYFYELFTPICLPGLTTALELLFITYLIGLYPLLLVIITYICIELHARFRPIIILCKPFSMCLAKLRQPYHASESVINVLATFLVLSYTKLLLNTLFILQPVALFTSAGDRLPSLYFFYNATIRYFHGNHLPAALAAIVIGLVLLVPPLLFLLYPFIWFQEMLERMHLRRHGLRAFMDVFQGHFKNGTEGTRDWRPFSAVYFGLKVLIMIMAFMNPTLTLVTYATLFGLVLVATTWPYKIYAYNVIECIIFAYYTALAHLITDYFSTVDKVTLIIIVLLYMTPGVCSTVYLVFLFLKKIECIEMVKRRVGYSSIVSKTVERVAEWTSSFKNQSRVAAAVEEDIPYRLEHSMSDSFSMVSRESGQN